MNDNKILASIDNLYDISRAYESLEIMAMQSDVDASNVGSLLVILNNSLKAEINNLYSFQSSNNSKPFLKVLKNTSDDL